MLEERVFHPAQSHNGRTGPMSTSVIYVGMDVHKDSIVIAVAREGREAAETWKTLPNDGAQLRKAWKPALFTNRWALQFS
jgi:hypothetical protein